MNLFEKLASDVNLAVTEKLAASAKMEKIAALMGTDMLSFLHLLKAGKDKQDRAMHILGKSIKEEGLTDKDFTETFIPRTLHSNLAFNEDTSIHPEAREMFGTPEAARKTIDTKLAPLVDRLGIDLRTKPFTLADRHMVGLSHPLATGPAVKGIIQPATTLHGNTKSIVSLLELIRKHGNNPKFNFAELFGGHFNPQVVANLHSVLNSHEGALGQVAEMMLLNNGKIFGSPEVNLMPAASDIFNADEHKSFMNLLAPEKPWTKGDRAERDLGWLRRKTGRELPWIDPGRAGRASMSRHPGEIRPFETTEKLLRGEFDPNDMVLQKLLTSNDDDVAHFKSLTDRAIATKDNGSRLPAAVSLSTDTFRGPKPIAMGYALRNTIKKAPELADDPMGLAKAFKAIVPRFGGRLTKG